MIIYGALFIPLITAIILFLFWRRKVVWWELAIPITASFVLVLISKLMIETFQTTSTEYWGSFIKQVEHYEDWNEYIQQTCTRSCCCDSKGENCSTETYDCSYVQYHPAHWEIITTTKEVVGISQQEYDRIKRVFGNETFHELHRNYYTNDGDEYMSLWPQDSLTAIPVTTVHYYENRVKAADESVFHFEEVSKENIQKYSLKGYPGIYSYEQDALIGYSGPDKESANKRFKYINGLLGHKKQVRLYCIVFEDQPFNASLYQEWLWSGGNMNEFVICIGTDKQHNVKWCKVVSWTTNEMLKVKVRDFVNSQSKLDLSAVAYFTMEQIDGGFQRRNFHEFDYLTVEPSIGATITVYILTILLNIGVSVWAVTNEYEE